MQKIFNWSVVVVFLVSVNGDRAIAQTPVQDVSKIPPCSQAGLVKDDYCVDSNGVVSKVVGERVQIPIPGARTEGGIKFRRLTKKELIEFVQTEGSSPSSGNSISIGITDFVTVKCSDPSLKIDDYCVDSTGNVSVVTGRRKESLIPGMKGDGGYKIRHLSKSEIDAYMHAKSGGEEMFRIADKKRASKESAGQSQHRSDELAGCQLMNDKIHCPNGKVYVLKAGFVNDSMREVPQHAAPHEVPRQNPDDWKEERVRKGD